MRRHSRRLSRPRFLPSVMLLVALAGLLSACAPWGGGAPPGVAVTATPVTARPALIEPTATSSPGAGVAPGQGEGTPVGLACPVTRPDPPLLPPPAVVGGTVLGANQIWYGNEALWLILPADGVAHSGKVQWWRTATGSLAITGRRLDGPAPPLAAQIPDGYGETGFQATGLDFPTPGCWEVTGTVAQRALRFVVAVYPRAYRPTDSSCQDVAAVARGSDAVVLGEVEGSTPDRPGFAWQTVRVTRAWKWRGTATTGERLDVLQYLAVEPPLERGRTYLLFLASPPGSPWRIVCPGRSLATVEGDRITGIQGAEKVAPLWSATTVADVDAQIRASVTATPGGATPAATPKP
jgi:hypothetical protein